MLGLRLPTTPGHSVGGAIRVFWWQLTSTGPRRRT